MQTCQLGTKRADTKIGNFLCALCRVEDNVTLKKLLTSCFTFYLPKEIEKDELAQLGYIFFKRVNEIEKRLFWEKDQRLFNLMAIAAQYVFEFRSLVVITLCKEILWSFQNQ